MWRNALDQFSQLSERGALRRFEWMTMDRDGHTSNVVPANRLAGWIGNDRAGALDRQAVAGQGVEAPVRYPEAVGCSFTPFYDQNVMLPNGDVVLCCMDYTLSVRLGNLLRQEYFELFSGEAMAKLHASNMRVEGPAEDPAKRTICRNCTRATRYRVTPDARQMWVEEKP